MKRAFTITILLAFLVVSATAQKAVDWVKYTSAEGRYSVLLPSEPKTSRQESATSDGIKFPQFLASSLDGNGSLMVGYFDNPPDTTFSFDKARDGLIKSMNATLISEDSISLGGSPGRQLKVSVELGGVTYIGRARIYAVGTRKYVLQCIFPKSEDGPAIDNKVGKFFDSFSITTGR